MSAKIRAGLIAALALAGCGAPAETRPSLSLVDELAAAPRSRGIRVQRVESVTGVSDDTREVLLPVGARARLHVRTGAGQEPGAELRLDALRATGAADGLEVRISSHGREQDVHSLKPSRNGAGLPLPADAVVRIDLIALGEGTGELRVREPRVVGAALATGSVPALRFAKPPDIVVYVVDTLRADALGPHMRELAGESLHFDLAIAPSPWTRPSIASLFTGLLPPFHGLQDAGQRLEDRFDTLAERLSQAGYQTAGFVSNVQLRSENGFGQGFDHYDQDFQGAYPMTSARDVTDAALRWLDQRDDDRPLFLYLHTVDPHLPYRAESPWHEEHVLPIPPPPANAGALLERARNAHAPGSTSPAWDGSPGSVPWMIGLAYGWLPSSHEMAVGLRSLYDGEVAENDAHFGRLAAGLRERDLWDDSLVVLTSDHGEEFYEHGAWTHSKTLHSEVIDVPLLVRLPALERSRAARRHPRAQLVDLLPTLLTAAGLESPPGIDGSALIGARSDGAAAPRVLFSFVAKEAHSAVSVLDGRWKLIKTTRPEEGVFLYDRVEDPGETTNLADDRPIERAYLLHQLSSLVADRKIERARLTQPDDATRRRLEALGYL